MGKRFKGFSKQEHLEAAHAINDIRQQLYSLSEKIHRAYGVSSPAGKAIAALVTSPDIMSKLKSVLDDAYFAEHGGDPKDAPYY